MNKLNIILPSIFALVLTACGKAGPEGDAEILGDLYCESLALERDKKDTIPTLNKMAEKAKKMEETYKASEDLAKINDVYKKMVSECLAESFKNGK